VILTSPEDGVPIQRFPACLRSSRLRHCAKPYCELAPKKSWYSTVETIRALFRPNIVQMVLEKGEHSFVGAHLDGRLEFAVAVRVQIVGAADPHGSLVVLDEGVDPCSMRLQQIDPIALYGVNKIIRAQEDLVLTALKMARISPSGRGLGGR